MGCSAIWPVQRRRLAASSRRFEHADEKSSLKVNPLLPRVFWKMVISKYRVKREWNPTNEHVFVLSMLNNVFHREMAMPAAGAVLGDKKEKISRNPFQRASSWSTNAFNEIIAAIFITKDPLCVHAIMRKQLARLAGDLRGRYFVRQSGRELHLSGYLSCRKRYPGLKLLCYNTN